MSTQAKTDSGQNVDSGFLSLLQLHRGGQVMNDLSDALREATESAQLEGKPAVINLKIEIKPAGNGSGAIMVADEIKLKLPQPAKTTSFFFADEHGNLHRNDPRQRELPLRAVEGGAPVDVEILKKVSAQ